MASIYLPNKADLERVANKLAPSWEADLDAAYHAVEQQDGTVPAQKTIAGLAAAIATIPGTRLNDFLESTQLIEFVNSDVVSIRQYACYGLSTLQTVSLPNATSIGASAFQNCSTLRTVSLPNATSVGAYVFNGCSNLQFITLPKATSVPVSCFYGCINLVSASFPMATNTGIQCFYLCSKLQYVSLPIVTSVSNNSFQSCSSLSVIDHRPMDSELVLSRFSSTYLGTSTANLPTKNTVHIWCSDGYLTFDGSAWVLNAYPDPDHEDSPTA